MAQTALTADIIAKEALLIAENEMGILDTFYRAPEDEFAKRINGYQIGETVTIRRPHDPRPRTGQTMNVQEVQEGRVALTIDQQIGHDFAFTSADLALRVEDISTRVIRPAMINIVNAIALDVYSQMYRGVYNWVGTPGNTVSTFAGYAAAPQRLDELAVMAADRVVALSPADHWGLVGVQTTLFSPQLVGAAYGTGKLKDVAGCDLYKSQVLPTHTTGSRTNTTPLVDGNGQVVVYATAKDTWTSTLTIRGAGNAVTYNQGDVFTIAGVNMVNPRTKAALSFLQQFVVMSAATTTAGGGVTLTVSPPLISSTSEPHQTISAAPVDGAAITNLGGASTAFRQNLAYHKNAMALAVVPLELPPGTVGGARQSYKGLSARVIPVYDGTNDVSRWRLDMLYGRKLVDPRIAVRLSGA